MSEYLVIKTTDSKIPSEKIIIDDNSTKKDNIKRDTAKLKVEMAKVIQSAVQLVLSLFKSSFYLFSVLGSALFLLGDAAKKSQDKQGKKKQGGMLENGMQKL